MQFSIHEPRVCLKNQAATQKGIAFSLFLWSLCERLENFRVVLLADLKLPLEDDSIGFSHTGQLLFQESLGERLENSATQ